MAPVTLELNPTEVVILRTALRVLRGQQYHNLLWVVQIDGMVERLQEADAARKGGR